MILKFSLSDGSWLGQSVFMLRKDVRQERKDYDGWHG